MATSIHDRCVLVLNKNWQAISIISAAEAFSHMATGNASGLEIEGVDAMQPIDWDDWLSLKIRPTDRRVGTASGAVRTPTVIVLKRYGQMPMYEPKFCLKNIWVRDNGVCQYSGKQLQPSEASIDHVIPSSRGGATSWENCVLADRNLNSRKGARTPAEAGLELRKRPVAPRPVPVIMTLRNSLGIPEWNYFLIRDAA